MKSLRKLLLMASVVVSFFVIAKAASPIPVYSAAVQLNAAACTEALVTVSSSVNTTVLAANANRMDFDIIVTTFGANCNKIYYAMDGAFTVDKTSNTVGSWIDLTQVALDGRRFRKPDYVMPVGAIVAQGDGAGCIVLTREWVNNSPIFQ